MGSKSYQMFDAVKVLSEKNHASLKYLAVAKLVLHGRQVRRVQQNRRRLQDRPVKWGSSLVPI